MSDYRITFSKTGSLAFISHLDFNHSFIRALKRAGLPLKYSEGFNPRPKISFGLPLSVGMEGTNELVDVSLTEDIPCEKVKSALEKAITGEMKILSVGTPEKKLKFIKYAEYTVEFLDVEEGKAYDRDKILAALSDPPPVMKRTKSGDKLTDIKPMIIAYDAEVSECSVRLFLTLTAYDSFFLNPDYVVKTLDAAALDLPQDYKITRTNIIFED